MKQLRSYFSFLKLFRKSGNPKVTVMLSAAEASLLW